ncbi:MAG: carboxymuconolactone decarboxylase family protein [Candidatus Limnocylindrales bacterium]
MATASYQERLRRLALHDERLLEAIMAGDPAAGTAPCLDERSVALVRLGALIAAGGPQSAFDAVVSRARDAGATVNQLVEALMSAAPLVGSAHVVAAAPKLATAVGYDVDFALERFDTGDDRP